MRLRNILFLVNGIALIAFLVIAIVGSRRHKPAPPMNLTPYYDDEVMEGPKLERFLGAAVIFSAILAASLPLYWLREPNRQKSMSAANFVSKGAASICFVRMSPPRFEESV